MLKMAEKAAQASPETIKKDDETDDLRQLEDYLNHLNGTETKKPSTGFTISGNDQDFSATLEKNDPANTNAQQEEINRQALIKKVAQLQSKYFADNQSARLFYASIRVLIPQIKKCQRVLGWRCNFANVVHPNGPGGCGDPSKGGEWICEDDVEWTDDDSFIFNGEEFKPQHVANP
jgi:hypothetical protein